MRLILTSKQDEASANIRGKLLEMRDWSETGRFEGEPYFSWGDFFMVTIEAYHLFRDGVDAQVADSLGIRPSVVIVASKHRSESGTSTLTVHPIGNFGKAEFGGKPRTLVPTSPGLMTDALRTLKGKARAAGLGYEVSFEVTHHGPFLETPTFYIEIGSLEEQWADEGAARTVAETILEARETDYPIAVGVGGGHYAPRLTDVALAKKVSFGHMLANYALEGIDDVMLGAAVAGTPGASLVYFHRKAMKKSEVSKLKDWFDSRGLRTVREEDLEGL